MHERLLAEVFAEHQRLATRRDFLTGGAKLAAGGALALTAIGSPGFTRAAFAQDATPTAEDFFESDVDVLNYALTLEHLEHTFYREGLEEFTFGEGPFLIDIDAYLAMIRDHEAAHVETLTELIRDIGGEPVAEAEYDFGYTDAASFLELAQTIETVGVSAYDGAASALSSPELLTAAGTIVAVEARHSSYLNLINGLLPFPGPFEEALPPQQVLEMVNPFIVGDLPTPVS